MSEPSARGSNGGKARKEKLSPERRKEIGKLAAAKRWAKKEVYGSTLGPIPTDDEMKGKYIGVPGVAPENIPIPIAPQEYHCPACTIGQSLEKGEGTHVLATIEHPAYSLPTTTVPTPLPEPPKTVQKRRKPMVKEFGKAHSYAEKRLAEALKERAESMNKVAMLNAEIPSLVQIIKALGMTPNVQGFQDFTAPIPNMNPYQQPQYQAPQTAPIQDVNPIDPALYVTNANPVPGLAPAIANAPVITNKPLGGAIDLGYTPVDEDAGPGLPNMGGGWQ